MSEWNGEGLPPVGTACQFMDKSKWFDVEIKYLSEWFIVFVCTESNGSHIADTKGVELCYPYGEFDNLKFRKPETEAERNERERLEAAYDLYCAVAEAEGNKPSSFNWFINSSGNNYMTAYLAIVDKTGYRKERP